MVLKSALSLVCAGLVLGVPIAIWSKRFAANVVENLPVETAVPVVLAGAATAAVAIVAAFVPARRAVRVNPAEALRR